MSDQVDWAPFVLDPQGTSTPANPHGLIDHLRERGGLGDLLVEKKALVLRALYQILPEDELPQSATFADGSPIPAGYVTQIRDCGLAAAVDVDWREGDLLLIDNVLVGHGRRPFTGLRRILVAMSA